ncbi:MAG: chemotaxis-specific protein-glutamate methyltransferase CheB [Planctomycetota bacterium]
MEKMRVLIADDSVVVRRVVTEELGAQPDIEVVGSASNGRSALEKLAQLSPDLVILDIEMPEMDGLTALPQMRKSHPHVPIVMFSSRTIDCAAATIEALARGAADFFAKPQSLGGLEASRQVIRNELIPALRALHAQRKRLQSRLIAGAKPTSNLSPSFPTATATSAASSSAIASPSPTATSAATKKNSETWSASGLGMGTAIRRESAQRVDLVVLAASTGGPNALVEIFAGLPAQFPVPLLIVQHMPPMFTQMLAERLTKTSKIPTFEAQSGTHLEPGKAWIAPGDYHVVVGREAGRWQLNVNQEPPENACRPAADPLLRSVSRSHGKHCLAVILTGMGQDGLRGCESLQSVGGQIIVQDEASSVVWGMPGYVAKASLAERVLPLPLIAAEIVRRVRHERG